MPPAGPGRQTGTGPDFDDLAGLSGLSGFSERPARPGWNADRDGTGPATGGPGRTAGPPGFADASPLPPPGAVPGAETRGTSPYRTPPPAGDAPDFTPDLPGRSGPNPYRPDTSGHPAPDPFRANGGEPGPNPTGRILTFDPPETNSATVVSAVAR